MKRPLGPAASHQFEAIKSLALVSDTHGLLRDSVTDALAGVDLIIHAGDVGNRGLLRSLEMIAPVIAVRGNVDDELVNLPLTVIVSVNGRLIYVLHDLNLLDLDPSAAGIAMVVSGHSHKPLFDQKRGVLFINPGSIGPRRFRLPVSFARVACEEKELAVQMVHLYDEF